jgi:hypothetical protein
MIVEESSRSGILLIVAVGIKREVEYCRVGIVGYVFWAATMAAKSIGGGKMALMEEHERASAMILSFPGMWQMSVVNSEMYGRWRADQSGETPCMVAARG